MPPTGLVIPYRTALSLCLALAGLAVSATAADGQESAMQAAPLPRVIQITPSAQRAVLIHVPSVGGTWRLRIPESIASDPTGVLLEADAKDAAPTWQANRRGGFYYETAVPGQLGGMVDLTPVGTGVLEFRLLLTNRGDWPRWAVEARISLYHDQKQGGESFTDPQLGRTYVVHEGKPTPVAQLRRAGHTVFLLAENQPDPKHSVGAYKKSLLPRVADMPLAATASESGRYMIGLTCAQASEVMPTGGADGRSVSLTAAFGLLAPGESKELIGRIYFVPNDPDALLNRFLVDKKEGRFEPRDYLQAREAIIDGNKKAYTWIACPRWAQEAAPPWVRPFLGRFGLPEPFTGRAEPIGAGCAGIDLWQANHFVVYRPETADYLCKEYTPTTVRYRRGTYPYLEQIVAKYTAGLTTDTDRAVALLTKAMPQTILHPVIPPCGPACAADRGMDEEELAKSGVGWCNEQARVYCRLCQAAGIPARLIFLQYSDRKHGHVVAEFFAEGRWVLADATWFCVMPGPDGRLMSAAECHEPGGKREYMAKAYAGRMRELLKLTDAEACGGHFLHIADEAERKQAMAKQTAQARQEWLQRSEQELADHLWIFGVMNYPLPCSAGNE